MSVDDSKEIHQSADLRNNMAVPEEVFGKKINRILHMLFLREYVLFYLNQIRQGQREQEQHLVILSILFKNIWPDHVWKSNVVQLRPEKFIA